PEHAFMLLDESSSFELIEMKDWAKNESQMKRLKGRVIGEDGKSKRTIEQLTDTHISVYGKTIGILGDSADVQTSRKAIEMLLSGARHATVYNLLENEQKKKKKLEFMDGEE
ncbi:MAG TPA: RNA-processing protein, partial [Candidatus Woesearchaeota archaeon]|nr:RNA-processing protein [Candidatus Woesearchaeota archaeon]